VFVEVEFAEGTPADQRSQIARRAADRLKSVLGLTIDVVEAAAPLPHFQDTHSKARRWRDERRR
jgi:hypothetical protein